MGHDLGQSGRLQLRVALGQGLSFELYYSSHHSQQLRE